MKKQREFTSGKYSAFHKGLNPPTPFIKGGIRGIKGGVGMTVTGRMKWFHQARFGMFIHWGLYSLLGRGEWVMYQERIPKDEYAGLAGKFNPKRFDANTWVNLAKDAGMKYVVLTTRHQDGFCLFDSKVSDFTSVRTAAGCDFVREYVRAVRKAGLKVGFYYSLLDWRFPGYFSPKRYVKSKDAMIQQVHSQVEELMTNYGRIDYLFYDGQWVPALKLTGGGAAGRRAFPGIARFWRAKKLNAMVKKLQPHIIINDRSGLAEDFDTPEQAVVASGKGRAWESCMTIGDSCGWGYVKNSPNFKPVSQLIQNLVTAAAGEGNYLLNIGPKPDGTVRKEEISRLKEIGKFMKVNGRAVYGSERSPVSGGMLGLTTAGGNTVYLHIFRWPGKKACIAGAASRVVSAKLLGSNRKLKVSRSGERLIISGLPEKPPNACDSVIAIKMAGKPRAMDVFSKPF